MKCEIEGCPFEMPEHLVTIDQIIAILTLHNTQMHSDITNAARANAGTIIKPMLVPTYGTMMSLKDYIQRLNDWNVATPSMTESQKHQLVL